MAMAMSAGCPDGDPEAAEVRLLAQLAQEAVLGAVRRRYVHHRFHGYAITARRQRQPEGWAIVLTLARHGQPLAHEALLLTDA